MFSNVGLPHGWCFFWQPGLLWLHVVSDSLIFLAYMLIPLALLRIIRGRKDIPFNGVVLCFVAFILLCGGTHAMEVYTLWHPVYWLSGALKAVTALVSLATVFILFHLTPAILKYPSSIDIENLNNRLNSVLESTSDGILTVGFDWVVLYLNRRVNEINPGMEIMGKGFWDCFPALLETPGAADLRKCMSDRVEVEYESHYIPYDRFFRTRAYPSNDGITIFFSDVTARRKLEMQLDQEKELKAQRIEALGHVAGGLAHEINNPLTIIQARASDLREIAAEAGAIPSTAVLAACDSILRTSNRAIRILRGLQGFAREGSKDPFQPCSLRSIADQAVELVERRFQAHNVDLQATVAPNLPEIECRDVQISQIMINLLNNAFDAIDSSGAAERWVRLDIAMADDKNPQAVRIDVRDSGPGVDDKSKAHLMEPFFTTKPLGAGLGVGLSLSRAIARDHGGSLELASVDGHTCFRLLLPVQQPSQPADSAAAAPGPALPRDPA